MRKGNYQVAFKNYEQEIRPYILLNQELGMTAIRLFKSQERKNLLTWIIERLMYLAPGRLIEFFINQSTKRINRAANAIVLKDYY